MREAAFDRSLLFLHLANHEFSVSIHVLIFLDYVVFSLHICSSLTRAADFVVALA